MLKLHTYIQYYNTIQCIPYNIKTNKMNIILCKNVTELFDTLFFLLKQLKAPVTEMKYLCCLAYQGIRLDL